MAPEDRQRSPHTGWVRHHWEATADHMLAAVFAHTTAHGSFVKTANDQIAITGLEGFARAGLLAAYRIAGSDDPAVRDPLLSWLGRGIEVGTRPGHEGAWPLAADRHQAIVEAAWVAVALAETKHDLWDQFDEATRRRVVQWLASVHGKAVHRNNWLMYPAVVDGFLAQVSGPTAPAQTARALDEIDAMHHRDGWYSDGAGSCFGHYSAWGVQLLLAHWLRMTGGDAFPGGPDVVRDRLRRFLTEYVYLIGSDGGPVLHGRSLIYRFAAAAPFWLGTLLDASPFSGAETRRITSSMLRHFVDRGALDEGIPPLGWYGRFPAMADPYSTPVSTLLCGEAFVGLLLPPQHPAWGDVEVQAVNDTPARTLATPGFVCMQGPDGVIRLTSHGASAPSVAAHPGYRRLGYSNRTAPATGALGDLDVDGQVTLLAGTGETLRRQTFALVAAGDRFAASSWTPVRAEALHRHRARARRLVELLPARLRPHHTGAGAARYDRIETATIARADMELRVTHVWSLDGGTIRDGGLAVSHREAPAISHGAGWCAASTVDGLVGAVIGLHGWSAAGWSTGVDASPFGGHSVVPYVDGDASATESLLVTAHILRQGPVDAESVRHTVEVEVPDRRVVILRVADGEEFFVQLYCPAPRHVELGPLSLDGTYRFARWSPDGTSWTLPA